MNQTQDVIQRLKEDLSIINPSVSKSQLYVYHYSNITLDSYPSAIQDGVGVGA